jgi:hypothetical protein
MAIEFNDDLEAIWRVDYDGGNWLAALSHMPPPAEGFEILYRFRWYVDGDLTRESKDIRNWYGTSITGVSLQDAMKRVAILARKIAEVRGGRLYQLFREGRNTADFMAAFASMPDTHSQTLEREPGEL